MILAAEIIHIGFPRAWKSSTILMTVYDISMLFPMPISLALSPPPSSEKSGPGAQYLLVLWITSHPSGNRDEANGYLFLALVDANATQYSS